MLALLSEPLGHVDKERHRPQTIAVQRALHPSSNLLLDRPVEERWLVHRKRCDREKISTVCSLFLLLVQSD
jgi:hypothetical protein